MTIALVVLIVLAIIGTIAREIVYNRASTKLQDHINQLEWDAAERISKLQYENHELQQSAVEALEALMEANLEMTFARLQVEKLNG